ncbi:MAG: phytanoyl-CoA dioxygenase family protein [Granulosicoccus sp.]|nr:phytanoyl-CoA dioxygenase family protein [Granulosicoccus sp.]
MSISHQYESQGFISPLDVVSQDEAIQHRGILEDVESRIGSQHYQNKIHTVMSSPFNLISQSKLLDAVAELIGPDIMVYNSVYIIKEPHTASHVSWHQDLTYWGLDSDEQVSAWIALSVADEISGCMRMIPGSHRAGKKPHDIPEQDDPDNVLYQSQTVHNVDESSAVSCPLQPGQASLHHGWTLHASAPNQSDDRRIGLNVQYISPRVKQIKQPGYSAMLLRGQDKYGHYAEETPARDELDLAALHRQKEMQILYQKISATS